MWVICSTHQTDSEDARIPLFWSVDLGWVSRKLATVFTQEMFDVALYIPLNSEWVNINTNVRISYAQVEAKRALLTDDCPRPASDGLTTAQG